MSPTITAHPDPREGHERDRALTDAERDDAAADVDARRIGGAAGPDLSSAGDDGEQG
jgi:hypothetical protein